jgi:phosphopantothenate-cysteine ligase
VPKARQALERYGHQVVIGNDLHHRKYRVVLISPTAQEGATTQPDRVLAAHPKYEEFWIDIDPQQPSSHPKEIEEDIIDELIKRHKVWIERA